VESPENKHNQALADIGLESYLKMLLFDRFFHVRSATLLLITYTSVPARHSCRVAATCMSPFDRNQPMLMQADLHPGNILVRVDDDTGPWNFVEYLKARLSRKSAEHLVLLDVGMVAELTCEDQLKFVDFFKVQLFPVFGAALDGTNVVHVACRPSMLHRVLNALCSFAMSAAAAACLSFVVWYGIPAYHAPVCRRSLQRTVRHLVGTS
jgi:ABC1 atypical kinase-like domain